MKKLFFIVFIFSTSFAFSETDLAQALKDSYDLEYKGDMKASYELLKKNYDVNNPKIEINWRLARALFQMSVKITDKNERIKILDEGVFYTKPFLNINEGTKRDQAELIYWYTVNHATKIKLQGVAAGQEIFNIIPEVFKLIDKCIKIDPEFTDAYFFLGIIYDDLPGFLGGDKEKSAFYYIKAIDLVSSEDRFLMQVESSKFFIKRNWTVNKKKSGKKKDISESYNKFLEQSDIEYAKKLLENSIEIYNSDTKHPQRDIDIIPEVNILIEKVRKNK